MNKNHQNSIGITKLDFIMGDKLAHFIVITLHLSPLRVGLIAYVFAISFSLLIALFSGTLTSGTLTSGEDYIGLFDDRFYFISETILIPLIWGYYAWVICAPYKVLLALEESNVILVDEKLCKEIDRYLNIRYINFLPIFLAIIFGILYYYQSFLTTPGFFTTSPISLSVRMLLVIIPTAYAVLSFVQRLILNARMFKKILDDVALHPLNPDGAGGLSPLGRYALSTTYIIGIAGSVAALAEYTAYIRGEIASAYFFHASIVGYLFFAPLSFFAPLIGAHDAMRRAKDGKLIQISTEFNQEYSKTQKFINKSASDLKQYIEKIEQLQKLYNMTKDFPVWPVNIEIIRRFAFVMSSPIVTIVTIVIADRIIDYLFKK